MYDCQIINTESRRKIVFVKFCSKFNNTMRNSAKKIKNHHKHDMHIKI